ncbi:MAG TPA: protease complex subunit PrcB family protein [Gemmatimonadales bacterium]|nr:protease complex subunit PrcB family protein [Gemmatimonadales bacterium]
MFRSSLLAVAFPAVLVACNGSREPAAPRPAIELSRFATDDATFAINSGYQTATSMVIRDSTAWAGAWLMLHEGMTPMPAVPAIDFGREMVILVAIGEQPNGGHSVRITSVTPDGDEGLLVNAVHSSAGPGCMVPQVITAPADIARVPASDAAVRFVVESATRDCAT